MLRLGLILPLAFLTVFSVAGPSRAADDEPVFLEIKLSSWIKMLEEGKTTNERRKGVIGIEQIGYSRSRKTVVALVKAVQTDKEAIVRAAAARALGRSVAKANDQAREDRKDELPKFETAREALVTAMRTDKSDAVREAATIALGDIGADARQAAGSLGGMLKDKNPAIVRAAATAIRRMGKEAKEAQPDLQALLASKTADAVAREEAAVSLGLLKTEIAGSLSVLKEVLADPKTPQRIRIAVTETLGKFGKEAGDGSTILGVVLLSKETTPELRRAVVTALEQLGDSGKGAVTGLIKAVGDPDKTVRCLAMQCLGKLNKELGDHRKDAVQAIMKSLDDGTTEVIVTGLEALGTLGSEGLAGETDVVLKKIDGLLDREGRKAIVEAAKVSRNKIRPPKK